ncbi:MAG: hypothetical protein RSC29_00710, partial [Oscillospiraceae bacterium]
MKSKLRNKIIALAIAGLMLVNVTAFAEAPLTSDVAVEDVAVEDVGAETILPNENQMLNIIDDDFTKFDGLDDAAIRTKLTDGGYTIIESADTITFSATAEKGLKMLRNGTSSDVSINRPLAQDGSTLTGIADDKTLMPGYVDYTFSYDQTAAYINASGNWKNIFFRTNINKSKPKEINTYLGTIVTLTNATDDIHVQYLVDSGAGNADGNSPQCVVNAFINGKQVVTNGENKYTSGGKNYYTSFLTNIGITLQKSNAVNGGSVYLKNMKVSKVVDETSDAFEKEALAVAP